MNTRNNSIRSARNSRFQRGSGVFTCDVCGRSTRDTGNGMNSICEQDYNIAGLDNQANDTGIKPNTKEWKVFVKEWCGDVNADLAKIAKLGGNVQKTVELNSCLFAEGHGFKVPVTLTASTVANVAKDMERTLGPPHASDAAMKRAHAYMDRKYGKDGGPATIDNVTSGTIFCRKPKGKKLQFIMGGPTLAEAPNMVRALPNFVYEWHSHDGSIKQEFTPKGVAAFVKTLTAKELVDKIEAYGQSLKIHVSTGSGRMRILDVEYCDDALWIIVAPESAS